MSLSNSRRPLVDLPDAFSEKIRSQPAAFSASTLAACSSSPAHIRTASPSRNLRRATALSDLAGMPRDAIAGGCERDTQRGPTSPVVALDRNVASTEPAPPRSVTWGRRGACPLSSSAPACGAACGVAAPGGQRHRPQ